MVYLKSFQLLSEDQEYNQILGEKRTIFNNTYPLRLFPQKQLQEILFSEITVFYGGNGSGKTTLLNIIADKTQAQRKNKLSKGTFFDQYVEQCKLEWTDLPETVKMISSDDIFDYLFDIRNINNQVNRKRDELAEEYLSHKYQPYSGMQDYDNLKKTVDARKQTMSGYIRQRLMNNNIIEQSNGESALMYFENEIQSEALYFLDEPENSLSAASQQKLATFITESARFYNCQFVLSTHSPFLLAMPQAHILDLDSVPATYHNWTELDNMRIYAEFFHDHQDEFSS